MKEEQLASLESKLQTLEKKLNETKADSSIEKDLNAKMQANFLNDMTELCATATKPSLLTIKELKRFLTS
jgi:division protein CdvB (Snf7/Vps24/ESCRT-III family)